MLEQANWVLAGPRGAAARLGMKRTTLQSLMTRRVGEDEQGQLQGANMSVASIAGVDGSGSSVGTACASCHRVYRTTDDNNNFIIKPGTGNGHP